MTRQALGKESHKDNLHIKFSLLSPYQEFHRLTSCQAEFNSTPSFRHDVYSYWAGYTCIEEMSASNSGQDTDYSDRAFRRFLQSFQAYLGALSIGHDIFLPVRLLFITVSVFFTLPATTWFQFSFRDILNTTGFPQAPFTNINGQMQFMLWDRTVGLASRLRSRATSFPVGI
jgi:hypothetical protein